MQRQSASFRDPSGHVFTSDNGTIYRTVTAKGKDAFLKASQTHFYQDGMAEGRLVQTEIVPQENWPADIPGGTEILLKHAPISFVSHPYEWPFALLKKAALETLDWLQAALKEDMTLSDASAYNLTIDKGRPVFIDVLSFIPYEEGQPWRAHRQFCEQFLTPLLLTSLFGTPYHAWYRGSIEGIPVTDFAPMLSWRHKLSFNIFSHIHLQAKAHLKAHRKDNQAAALSEAGAQRVPRKNLAALWAELAHFIDGLTPKGQSQTVWQDYEDTHTYQDSEVAEKKAFIAQYAKEWQPESLWDIGCNTGFYLEVALSNGAKTGIGFDADTGALDKAVARAADKDLPFTALYLDATDPTPAQGWQNKERAAFMERRSADSLQALAVLHHLVIGRNIPLEEAVAWLVSLAPKGVIEFVPKNDTTIQRMLALREDFFDSYTQENFEKALESQADIVEQKTVTAEGRVLYAYKRLS